MSCIKACFDDSNPLYGHEDCHTCPWADNGPRPQRSTDSCQETTELVELTGKEVKPHRYAGSFGE